MTKPILFAAVAMLFAAAAFAQDSSSPPPDWLQDSGATETSTESDPVFVPGIDSGGAGNELQPGPGCRLAVLCVNDAHCREIWQGFWACAWLENSACDSIYCEYGG